MAQGQYDELGSTLRPTALASALHPGAGGGFGAALPNALPRPAGNAASNQVLHNLGLAARPLAAQPAGLTAGQKFMQQAQWGGGGGGNTAPAPAGTGQFGGSGNILTDWLNQKNNPKPPVTTPPPAKPTAPGALPPGTTPTVHTPGTTPSGAYLPPTMQTFAPTESWMGNSYGWDFPSTSATPPGYKPPTPGQGGGGGGGGQNNPLIQGGGMPITGQPHVGGANVPQVGNLWQPGGGRAEGGAVDGGGDGEHEVYHGSGLIHSQVAGRTDRIPLSVAAGAYVMPADVVSGLGEGNTLAGSKVLDIMMHTGPFGTKQPERRGGGRGIPAPPALQKFARGGRPKNPDDLVKVIVAGGEYIVHPIDAVKWSRAGDLSEAHDNLDEFVKNVRRKTVREAQKLPGPKT